MASGSRLSEDATDLSSMSLARVNTTDQGRAPPLAVGQSLVQRSLGQPVITKVRVV